MLQYLLHNPRSRFAALPGHPVIAQHVVVVPSDMQVPCIGCEQCLHKVTLAAIARRLIRVRSSLHHSRLPRSFFDAPTNSTMDPWNRAVLGDTDPRIIELERRLRLAQLAADPAALAAEAYFGTMHRYASPTQCLVIQRAVPARHACHAAC